MTELGPCNVTEELATQLNPYAWNEVSNLLFLSQPLGVGFSYGSKVQANKSRKVRLGLTIFFLSGARID